MKDIIGLLKRNEKEVCVTIVLNEKFKSFDDKERLQARFRKIIATAKKVLNAEHGEETAGSIAKQLNAQLFNLDFGKARESLVVFAAEGFGKLVWLPFAEKERLIIRNSFDVQPLTDAMNRERNYWVLALSKNKTRLFRGKNEKIEEVINTDFPVSYGEQFQYDKTHANAFSYMTGLYAGEESKIDKERMRAFFRHVDHLLKPVLQKESLPLILMGVQENLSKFSKVASVTGHVAAGIRGNYDYYSAGQIAKKAWPLAKKSIVPEVALQ